MTFPVPFPPEDPPPPPWWEDGACDARPIDDAESVAVTSFRAFGRDDTPSDPYRGGSRRRRFGLDEDDDTPRRFDRWRNPEGK